LETGFDNSLAWPCVLDFAIAAIDDGQPLFAFGKRLLGQIRQRARSFIGFASERVSRRHNANRKPAAVRTAH
jgi:hypothetical protein